MDKEQLKERFRQQVISLQGNISAMKSAGQSDDSVVDRIVKNPNIDDNIKQIFSQAQSQKNSSGAITDFLAIKAPKTPIFSEQQLQPRGVLQNIAEATGVGKLTRGLSQRFITDKKELERQQKLGVITPEEAELVRTGGVSGRQLAGAALQTGLTVASPFIAGGIAKNLATEPFKRFLANRSVDAVFGIAGGMQDKDITSRSVLSDALSGAIIGGLFSLGTTGAIKMLKSARDLPENFYSKFFKAVDKDINAEWQSIAKGQKINPTLAKEMLNEGVKGSSETMGVFSIKKLEELEKALQVQAKGIKTKISLTSGERKDALGVLDLLKERYSKGAGSRYLPIIKDFTNKIKAGKMSVNDAIDFKRFFDKMRNSSSFKMNPAFSPYQEDLRIVSNDIRNRLHKFNNISELLNKERIYINGLGDLLEFSVKERNGRLFNLIDVVLLGGGSMAGVPIQGFGAMAAARTFQHPSILTPTAQFLERGIMKPAERILTKPAIKTAGRALQQWIRPGLVGGTTRTLSQ